MYTSSSDERGYKYITNGPFIDGIPTVVELAKPLIGLILDHLLLILKLSHGFMLVMFIVQVLLMPYIYSCAGGNPYALNDDVTQIFAQLLHIKLQHREK